MPHLNTKEATLSTNSTTTPLNQKPIILLYHNHCQDGLGAVVSARRGLQKLGITPQREIPRIINKEEEFEDVQDIEGSILIYMDFCPRGQELLHVSKHNIVMVLDHHDTSKRALEGVGDDFNDVHELLKFSQNNNRGLSAKFCMDKSGAGLSWDFFHPNEKRPTLIELIEDRDLWKFNYVETDAVSTLLHSMNLSPSGLSDLITETESDNEKLNELYSKAQSVVQYRQTLINEISRGKHFLVVDGCSAIICNSQCLHSDLGNYLLEKHPDQRISIIFHINSYHGFTKLSLRGNKGDSFAMNVAEILGGGGHPSAAGARISSVNVSEVINQISDAMATILRREEKEREEVEPF